MVNPTRTSQNGTDSSQDGSSDPLKAFRTMMAGFSQTSGSGNNDEPNFFKLIIGILTMLLGGKMDDGPVGYEGDGTKANAPTEQNMQDAVRRDEVDRKQGPSLTETAVKKENIIEVTKYAARLSEMRADEIRENHGSAPTSIMPVETNVRVTDGFGKRPRPKLPGGGYGSENHQGIDLARDDSSAPAPKIRAATSGIVLAAGYKDDGYGYSIVVANVNGMTERYGHLAAGSIMVKPGQEIHKGNDIATMGSTGNSTGLHLHYEQRRADGTAINPEFNGQRYALNDRIPFTPFDGNSHPVYAAAQTPGQSSSVDNLLAQLDLSFAQPDKSYVSPNTGTSKSAGLQSGRGAGG